MNIDLPSLIAALPILSTIVLGILAYQLNVKVQENNKSRILSQNEVDQSTIVENYANVIAASAKTMADDQDIISTKEARIVVLEALVHKQKLKLILELYVGEKPRVDNAIIERIGTGPLKSQ